MWNDAWTISLTFLCLVIVMGALWLVQRRTGDAGIVDVAWGLGVGIAGSLFSLLVADGDFTRRIVIAALVMIWSIRLSGYILIRVIFMSEDGRYLSMKEASGANAQSMLFWFYQLQAVAAFLFALPMLLAGQNTQTFGTICDGAAIILFAASIIGESVADSQLHRFRNDPTRTGTVCKTGLWKYSRHPNYFFEWLHWWSYLLLSIGAAYGWLNIIAPLIMLIFILKITGIPPTEAQSLKSRGDAYREYQKTTSAFFPWPPSQ